MIRIPVSVGEFIDKISILMIKSEKIKDVQKAKNINNELDLLLSLADNIDYNDIQKLKEINLVLWNSENKIRKTPDLKTALEICNYNDLRANIKSELNYKYNSIIKEEKHYESSNNRTY